MPYSKNNIEDGVKFDVQPNKAPSAITYFLVAIAPVLIFVFMCASIYLLVILAVITIGIAFFVDKSAKYTKYRDNSTFIVNDKGVTKSGNFYSSNDIQRILYKNHIDNFEYIALVSSRPTNAATVHGLESYFKQNQKLAAVSYRVDIESNGKPITLCGGLTEPEAFAILSDISKILDFKMN